MEALAAAFQSLLDGQKEMVVELKRISTLRPVASDVTPATSAQPNVSPFENFVHGMDASTIDPPQPNKIR